MKRTAAAKSQEPRAKSQPAASTNGNGAHQHGPHCNHDHGHEHGHGHAGIVAEIRLFTKADHKQLTEIWKAGHIDIDACDTAAMIEKNMRTRKQGYRLFVISTQEMDEDGQPVGKPRIAGGATVTFDGRRAYVYQFAVHPDFRGLGLGRALLSTCEKEAASWGATQLRLTARADGSRAIAQKLYESEGWKPAKDLWVYGKKL